MIDVRRLVRAIAGPCAAVALCTGSAAAQPPPAAPPPEVPPVPAEREGPTPREGDFALVNPGIGFGWFGLSDVPVGSGTDAVSAPVLGIRWWMGAPLGPFRAWGLDLGFGLGRTSTDAEPHDVTRTGFILHAGMPLAVSATKHVAIEFVPEMNLGFASGSDATGADLGGSRFDVGARAGAEIFFGFMGLPQLSLEASVGLYLTRENRSSRPEGGSETSVTTLAFGTTVHDQPWDVFRSSVAARYYF